MATGRLGASAPSATTYTEVYRPPSGKTGTFSVSVCNRGATQAAIRVALAVNAAAPTNGEFIEYDTTLTANESMQITGIVLGNSHALSGYASTADVSFVAWGIEE